MKYYFIYYKCTRYGWLPKELGGASTGSYVVECQAITDIHPIQWQIDCNEEYDKERVRSDGHVVREEYMVVSWQELTKLEYEKYNGNIG